MLELTNNGVIADGRQLADNKTFAASTDLNVRNVYNWLLAQKARAISADAEKKIILQCDRGLEFNIVKRIMYTCSKAGFTDFSVLVIEE